VRRHFVAEPIFPSFANFSEKEGGKTSSKRSKNIVQFCGNLTHSGNSAIMDCLGSDWEIAMACHLRVASHNARNGLPEVFPLGVIRGLWRTQRLHNL